MAGVGTLLKQAQKMQRGIEALQTQLEAKEIEITSGGGAVKLKSLMHLWFLLPCISFALIQSTHFFLGAMGALVWKIDGVPEGWMIFVPSLPEPFQ